MVEIDDELQRLELADYIIGLEATIERQEKQLQADYIVELQQAINIRNRQLRDLEKHYLQVIADTEQVAQEEIDQVILKYENSRTWRVGKLILAPLKYLKRS